ncbi:hypothetical protein [Mesorhizobium sp.]|uniref:hypothetical protein n=1 Tax=Mesorhizobium sp. TaxID=1871066 RepID=UPI000FE98641|nr:hypothetical protein [Mesorhizobium sp.]RWO86003.1 MAG: hypothetical protein EOQ95_22965 [Mesorhizobium sp.]
MLAPRAIHSSARRLKTSFFASFRFRRRSVCGPLQALDRQMSARRLFRQKEFDNGRHQTLGNFSVHGQVDRVRIGIQFKNTDQRIS